jgi:hypothetical protein
MKHSRPSGDPKPLRGPDDRAIVGIAGSLGIAVRALR